MRDITDIPQVFTRDKAPNPLASLNFKRINKLHSRRSSRKFNLKHRYRQIFCPEISNNRLLFLMNESFSTLYANGMIDRKHQLRDFIGLY